MRKSIGPNKLSKLFSIMHDQLQVQGYMSEVFTFVDSTHLISKANLWAERDKQARIGCKKHVSVDMQKWYDQ